jgi:hypothetical protein
VLQGSAVGPDKEVRGSVLKRSVPAAPFVVLVGVVLTDCSGAPAPSPDTWMVDCVGILGIPTPSGQTPLEAVPRSGVPRDVHLGDLTDAQLGQFADWMVCVTGNGYRSECCSNTQCPYLVAGEPPGPFVLETTPVLASALATCYTATFGNAPLPSREETITLFRTSLLSGCHVGSYEDCIRESAVGGFEGGAAPDCAELNNLCEPLSD